MVVVNVIKEYHSTTLPVHALGSSQYRVEEPTLAPGKHQGDSRHGELQTELLLRCDALLLGRRTYEGFAPVWSAMSGDPYTDHINAMEKWVVSSTLTDPAWNNTRVLSGAVVEGIAELKAGEGGPIQVPGSGSLVHLLLDNDLVDELRLMVFPVSIGAGLRVFPDTQKKSPWKRTDTVEFPNGVRVDTYLPLVEPELFD